MAAPGNTSSSSGISAIDDCSSPYFLHHSDSPGLVLVPQPLNGENYSSWSRAMLMALSVKNKLGFVDGSLPKPSSTDTSLLSAWMRSNHMVTSWILNSVSKDIAAGIIFSDSASAIWSDLKERFQQLNGQRIFQLRRELISLTQQQLSVSVYFTKLKSIWDELSNFRPVCSCGLCSCGGVKELDDHYQSEYVMAFLMGLNDSFSQVRALILLMDPLPSINEVFSLIAQEERQRQIISVPPAVSVSATSPKAVDIRPDSSKAATRFSDGPNRASEHSNSGSRGSCKDRPFCNHCNLPGHAIETCYKLHGYPPGVRPRPQSFSHSTVNLAPAPPQPPSTPANPSAPRSGSGDFFSTLSPSLHQELMSKFFSHLASRSSSNGDLDSSTLSAGLNPEMYKFLFGGKENGDDEFLQAAGGKDNSEVLHVEDTPCEQNNLGEVNETRVISKGEEAVAEVRKEIDKLEQLVSALQVAVYGGNKVDDKEINYLSEMHMRQLIKLDGIEAEGEGKVQRKMEVRRVQSIVETLDALKSRNSNALHS